MIILTRTYHVQPSRGVDRGEKLLVQLVGTDQTEADQTHLNETI